MDGVSVTAHWSGTNENLHGGFGQIWRHDITDSVVKNRVMLSEGPARNPVISPDGTRVAFARCDNRVCVMPLAGGEVRELSTGHGEGCLDWPSGDWIYYNKGRYDDPEYSAQLHRVNAVTGADEHVVTWCKGIWRFGISRDLTRAAVRPNDTQIAPKGCVTAYDMVNDNGVLRKERSTRISEGFRCCTGIDPAGDYLMIGNREHTGTSIARWEDIGDIVFHFDNEQAVSWGPDTRDSGLSHNRNTWSSNSSKWICIHMGWGFRGAEGANQILINWVDKKRVRVTDNEEGSKQFDCCGDLWVSKE
ncbi:MAG: hypothetical protein GF418_15915 [Chitinivibrionales bacterium]|nr:hypothetical protein [Chitinivibrionales bacterium]MBD3397107.1 hypothetical protein [Chitinivibrionales bacterium]